VEQMMNSSLSIVRFYKVFFISKIPSITFIFIRYYTHALQKREGKKPIRGHRRYNLPQLSEFISNIDKKELKVIIYSLF
jgi:hypothetical protein